MNRAGDVTSVQTGIERRGFTLLEVVLSAASAGILVAGMASAISLSNAAATSTPQAQTESDIRAIQQRIASDVQIALAVTTGTADEIVLVVPDRTLDGNNETIRYFKRTVGADTFLSYQENGGPIADLTSNVDDVFFVINEVTP